MLAGAEHLLEMLARLGIVYGEPEPALGDGIEAVDQHAGLEHLVALAVVKVARCRRRGLDLDDIGRHDAVQEPAQADAELGGEAGQERQIEAAPQEPGEKARQLDAVDVKLSGFFAWLLWRGFYLSFLPGFAAKFRVG